MKSVLIAVGITTTILTLMPSRNVAVMIVAAPTIVNIAADIKDSNATVRIENILDNSLKYLEDKSQILLKE